MIELEFCGVRSRIFQEMWVAAFAWLDPGFFMRHGSRILPRFEGKGARGSAPLAMISTPVGGDWASNPFVH